MNNEQIAEAMQLYLDSGDPFISHDLVQSAIAHLRQPSSAPAAVGVPRLTAEQLLAITDAAMMLEHRGEHEMADRLSAIFESASIAAPSAANALPADSTVTVRYDLAPANVERAIRDKLIRMGWTPPDSAAAPAASDIDPLAEIERLVAENDKLRGINARLLAAHQPPASDGDVPMPDCGDVLKFGSEMVQLATRFANNEIHSYQLASAVENKLRAYGDARALAALADLTRRHDQLLVAYHQVNAALASAAKPSGLDAIDAARWRALLENHSTALIIDFFGNGCINKTIADVVAQVDAAIATKEAAQ